MLYCIVVVRLCLWLSDCVCGCQVVSVVVRLCLCLWLSGCVCGCQIVSVVVRLCSVPMGCLFCGCQVVFVVVRLCLWLSGCGCQVVFCPYGLSVLWLSGCVCGCQVVSVVVRLWLSGCVWFQSWLIRWMILTYDLIDDKDMFHAVYTVFFHFLQYETMASWRTLTSGNWPDSRSLLVLLECIYEAF